MLGTLLAAALAAGVGAGAGAPSRPAFVFSMGFDRGSEELVDVAFSDGSTQTLRANEGLYFAAGLAFLRQPLGSTTLDTVATVGVKGWDVGADNGKVSYLAFPLELVERISIEQVRFGAGISYLVAPRISSDGDLSAFGGADLKNSLGIVWQAEWIGARRGPQGFFVGVRGVWQKLEAKQGFGVIDANAFGLYFGGEL